MCGSRTPRRLRFGPFRIINRIVVLSAKTWSRTISCLTFRDFMAGPQDALAILLATRNAQVRRWQHCRRQRGKRMIVSSAAARSRGGLVSLRLSPSQELRGSARAPHDAPKTDVAGGRVDRLSLARRRAVAQAVVGRAEVRPAFHHSASDMRPRLARRAAGFFTAFNKRGKKARRPLPHVAHHVLEAIT